MQPFKYMFFALCLIPAVFFILTLIPPGDLMGTGNAYSDEQTQLFHLIAILSPALVVLGGVWISFFPLTAPGIKKQLIWFAVVAALPDLALLVWHQISN